MAATALDGLRVLELGGEVVAVYATKLLADLGADVLKVEPPGGDPLRGAGPFGPEGADVARGGGLFRYLNGAKRSTVVDLSGAAGAQWFRDACATADLVVEHLGAGGLERFGLAPDVLAAANPQLAIVRVSDVGQHGPYAGITTSGLTLQALGAWITTHGVPTRPPCQVGGRIHEYAAASYTAAAALSATRAARAGAGAGEPVVVDVSVMECLVGSYPYFMILAADMVKAGLPLPQDRHFPLPGIVRCKDGWVGINALTGQHFIDACTMFGVEGYGPRLIELMAGGPALDEFFDAVQPWLDARTAEEIVEVSQAFRVPAGPIGDARMMLDFTQFRERPFFVEEDGVKFPGPPYRLGTTPAARRAPAPVLAAAAAPARSGPAAIWPSPARATAMLRPGRRAQPWAGLRIVDMTNFWAGPMCTMYLAALGAEVVKVESRRRPDGMRFSGASPEMGEDWYDRSGVFAATNLNKRAITLELDREKGRAAFLRLVERADVVVENFATRVAEQFGVGYEELRAVRPDLIMVRMPAFGLEGPWRDYVGWAMVIEQASGMATVTGPPDLPMHPGGIADPIDAMHAAVALQAALEHRDRTGEGQLIEVAQLETGANLTAQLVLEWSMAGREMGRAGNRDDRFAPQGAYRCADDGDEQVWFALTVENDEQWWALTEVVGRRDWADDEQLATLEGRRARHDELDAHLEQWAHGLDVDDVVGKLRARGVPAARVLTVPHMYGEPQLEARGYYQELPHPKSGPRRYPGWPMQFSFLATPHRTGAPTMGQHNAEVLGELGYTAEEITALERDGVIGDRMFGS